ncbi:MAG: tetratricopeptide repeat protein [Acidobacteriota bacterium]
MSRPNVQVAPTYRIQTEQGRYYFAAALALMLSSVAFRLGAPGAGVMLLAAFPLLLVLARYEVLIFDGICLRRCGLYAWWQGRILGGTTSLPIAQLELSITEVVYLPLIPTRYRFRTILVGNGFEAVLFSNITGYAPFVQAVFMATDENKLDFHSLAWLRYGAPPPLTGMAEGLDDQHLAQLPAALLRFTANYFTLTGHLRLARRYFQQAYRRDRGNPHLLCEMGYFFRRFALAEDTRWQLRASACLRLAARLAQHEPRLLERIGEAYCEVLDAARAERCFRKALELDRQLFRAYAGLAELAFRNGQLARVAHFYYAAASSAGDVAMQRRAQREARYYEQLSQDSDYLEAEVRRITWLHHIHQMRTTAGGIFFVSWLAVGLAGQSFLDIQDIGLAMMGSSGLVWLGLSCGLHWQRRRSVRPETAT